MFNMQYGDINYGEISQGEEAAKAAEQSGNVAASREISNKVSEAKGQSEVESYFREENRRAAEQFKLNEARATTAQMKQAIQFKNENFDKQLQQSRYLSNLDAGKSKELLESEKNFKVDSFNRKYMSERQLADWYNTKAASEEDWANYSLRTTQLYDRKLQIMQTAYAKLEQIEQQTMQREVTDAQQAALKDIAEKKRAMADAIQRDKNRAANSAAMISGFSAAGMAVGSIWGPAGTAVGGVAGAAVGKAVADNTQKD